MIIYLFSQGKMWKNAAINNILQKVIKSHFGEILQLQ